MSRLLADQVATLFVMRSDSSFWMTSSLDASGAITASICHRGRGHVTGSETYKFCRFQFQLSPAGTYDQRLTEQSTDVASKSVQVPCPLHCLCPTFCRVDGHCDLRENQAVADDDITSST